MIPIIAFFGVRLYESVTTDGNFACGGTLVFVALLAVIATFVWSYNPITAARYFAGVGARISIFSVAVIALFFACPSKTIATYCYETCTWTCICIDIVSIVTFFIAIDSTVTTLRWCAQSHDTNPRQTLEPLVTRRAIWTTGTAGGAAIDSGFLTILNTIHASGTQANAVDAVSTFTVAIIVTGIAGGTRGAVSAAIDARLITVRSIVFAITLYACAIVTDI